MAVLPPPTEPFTPDSVAWANYFLELSKIEITAAPLDARYLVATSNGDLTNDVNLGLLSTGLVFLTVAAGIATPSTVTLVSLLRGGTGADLSATGGTGQVVRQDSAGGALTVGALTAADLAGLSGTYTPNLTNVTNLAASTAYECQYVQVGSVVTVSGLVDVDPTAAGACELGLSLPVASNFTAVEQCAGAGVSAVVAGFSAAVLADATNNRAALQWVAVDTANRQMAFTYTYRIL